MEKQTQKIRPVILVFETSRDSDAQMWVCNIENEIIADLKKGRYIGSQNNEVMIQCIYITPTLHEENHTDTRSGKSPFSYKVQLNQLIADFCELEYLRDDSKYLQPIVLFILDGTIDYALSLSYLLKFRKSYIYNNSMRLISCFGDASQKNINFLNLLCNKNCSAGDMKVFYRNPHMALNVAFIRFEGMHGQTCIKPEMRTVVVRGKLKEVEK